MMTLKYQLNKEEFDSLSDKQKVLYKASGDNYQMYIEGLPEFPDVSGLQKKVNELLSEKKAEQEKRRQAEEAAKKAAEEQARKNGDIAALEKSWSEKLVSRENELLNQIEEKDTSLRTLLVDNVAQSLAAKLAGDSAELLLPHIKSRLTVEEGKTRIIDAEGKPSAATLDDLEKEMRRTGYLHLLLLEVRRPEQLEVNRAISLLGVVVKPGRIIRKLNAFVFSKKIRPNLNAWPKHNRN